MPRTITLPIAALLLSAGLVFPTLSPYTAVYVTLSLMVVSIVGLFARQSDHLGALPYRLVLLALLILTAMLPFVWQGTGDLIFMLVLAPLLLAPAVPMLLAEEHDFNTGTIVALFCLFGALAGTLEAVYEVFVLGVSRAGGTNNPIHFGGIAVLLGFFALTGLFGTRSQWRFLFLLGPAFGLAATMLSASRGPMLAVAAISLLVGPLLVRWFWRQTGFRIVLVLMAIAGVAVLFFGQLPGQYSGRSFGLFSDISQIFSGQASFNDQVRLAYYQAAVDAFEQAPWFGHGAGQMISAPAEFYSAQFAFLATSEHLHSDLADFAVLGGTFGLLAYALLLIAPFTALRGVIDPDLRHQILVGAIVLGVGIFSLGLTNAVFGILPQTVLYALLLGILMAFSRSPTPGASEN